MYAVERVLCCMCVCFNLTENDNIKKDKGEIKKKKKKVIKEKGKKVFVKNLILCLKTTLYK